MIFTIWLSTINSKPDRCLLEVHLLRIPEGLLLTKELVSRSRQMAISLVTRFCIGSNRVYQIRGKVPLTTPDGRSVSLRISRADLKDSIIISKDNWSRKIMRRIAIQKRRIPLILLSHLLTVEIIICSPIRKLMSLITKIFSVLNISPRSLECSATIL